MSRPAFETGKGQVPATYYYYCLYIMTPVADWSEAL